ncbi:MAG: hypothetical protein WAK61_01250 [Leclercia sp.]
MKTMIAVGVLLTSTFAYGASVEEQVASGVRAYQAAKCIAYAEIAGKSDNDTDSYDKLSKIYSDNVSVYIENSQNEEFKMQALDTTIPITWFGMVYGNRLDKTILAGRLLEWTNMVETQRVADTYASGERVVSETAGMAAFNTENCILLIK